jgi:hypothetical protein
MIHGTRSSRRVRAKSRTGLSRGLLRRCRLTGTRVVSRTIGWKRVLVWRDATGTFERGEGAKAGRRARRHGPVEITLSSESY